MPNQSITVTFIPIDFKKHIHAAKKLLEKSNCMPKGLALVWNMSCRFMACQKPILVVSNVHVSVLLTEDLDSFLDESYISDKFVSLSNDYYVSWTRILHFF